jgi:serine/threonine protein kinase/tetratricopeptide (TPR) repeat protein
MIGTTVSHYSILEKIGEGGMGVVYKARDLTLDRIVALKFLPPHASATNETNARFIQEARSAAALNYPHICTVYGLEEHDGSMFIVMEFIEGGTLASRIPFASVNDAVTLAIQIGEALHEAHNKGIVHRDVKADNVMLTKRGDAKVMDFGLAKLKGSLKLTKTSSTVGTLAYMAPEQIEGGTVDARSDIFSFGVLLFEMLTGRFPFAGEHQAAMMYSILNQEPLSLESVLPSAPAALANIIAKTLEKDPAMRYQSLADCIVDLSRVRRDSSKVHHSSPHVRPSTPVSRVERPTADQPTAPTPRQSTLRIPTRMLVAGIIGLALLGTALILHPWSYLASGKEKKTLAVLPFENLAGSEREYFSDGITEEITTRLSGLSGLSVIARSSTKEYKKAMKSVKVIGGELNADYILMGTVRWLEGITSPPRVRVTSDLVRVTDGIQVWSQANEATLSDVFGLQSMIASQVAEALDVKLLQPERQTLATTLTSNAKAYDLYLRGIQKMEASENPEVFRTAKDLFEQAIALDPQFAAAWARLSIVHSDIYWFFYDRSRDQVARARDAADHALALAPRLSEAHAAKGWYLYHCELDYRKALAEFDDAILYQPNNPDVTYGMAAVKRRQGDIAGAVIAFQKAVEQDPRTANLVRQLGETLLLDRRYSEAEDAFARASSLDPSDLDNVAIHARNQILWKGDIASARAIVDAGLKQPVTFRRDDLLLFRAYLEMATDHGDDAMTTLGQINPKWTADDQFSYTPYASVRGQFELYRGNLTRARTYFESARTLLEKELKFRPDDERYHSALGIIYAGLGRKEDAIREAEHGLSLLPVEKEAWRGTFRLADLARVHAMAGDSDKAVELLQHLLAVPSEFSPHMLRLHPAWKSLRGNPKFEELIRNSG